MKRNAKLTKMSMLIAFLVFTILELHAQGVTTAQLFGQISDSKGSTLIAASIHAVHMPSGTSYGVYSRDDGRFNIPNMRVGGPYSIKITYVGFGEKNFENIFLELGENKKLNIALEESTTALAAVEIIAKVGTIGEISGTGTQISAEKISNIPTINRDIDDFLKLTPQASSYSDGITFGGMNNRYNAIYIDGAVNNDVYGISSSGTNGGSTGISPFSIDIIDQLQVVLSPYDVSYGGFAGGGINAVTKSGTNEFHGTAYYFSQNESLAGKSNKTYADRYKLDRVKLNPYSESTYGFSLGGPILKNKLFFFANAEIQKDETPAPFDVVTYAGKSKAQDLENFRQALISKYNYDPGDYGNTSDNLDGLKLFVKLDYNLNDNNRVTFRHNYTKAEQYDRTAGSTNRINFSNSGIYFPSITNSTAIELNSRFKNKFSNNLILGFTSVKDDRDPIGGDFPYLIINDGGNNSIRLGSEEFSTANKLDQNIFTITDNFKIYNGAHTITIGTHNEFYDIYNLFIGQNYGTYTYDSLSGFLNNDKAKTYVRAYSLVDDITGDGSQAAGVFKAMQLGVYLQDDWEVTNRFRLTGGVRVDVPFITSDPKVDTFFNNTALPKIQAKNDIANNIVAGQAPDGQILISPRIGFHYDLKNSNRHILRGGVGVFTSRIPFVWPGAIFTNNGLTLGRVTEANVPGGVTFVPTIGGQYTNPGFKIPSGQYDLFVKDFKYPQVFKANLGFDTKLPFDINLTIEGIYTKILNNVVYYQVNSDTTGSFNWSSSTDNRTVFPRKSIEATYSSVYVADNTNEGDAYTLTASLAKNFGFGLSALLAYSYGDANSLMDGTSSQNSSQWRGQISVNGRNNPTYGRADYAMGHRFISNLSYKINWFGKKNFATTISIFYEGKTGSPFSYVIGGTNGQNINNEVGSTSRNRSLIYIPKEKSDINLVDYTSGTTTITADEQWTKLNDFIESDDYLSKNRGNYAEKNSNFMPFTSFLDLAIKQDLGININGKMHTFQLSADIFNLANLINSEWGVRYTVPGSDFNNYQLYTYEKLVADPNNANKVTKPTFTYRGGNESGKKSLDILNGTSRWELRLGARYFF
ncbi:MAG: carboxypeptidase regulatory-like domain-containing protein [Saprospiraceae bacterium]|nr:carboxypeptidase regulatory-like domain-containing protein [Saprospiraceae bacterium]